MTILTDPVKDVIIPKIQSEIIIPKKHEYKMIGSLRKRKGLTFYQCNLESGEVIPVKIESKIAIGLDGKEQKTHKVNHKRNTIYLFSLNKKNAIRKFQKIIDNDFSNYTLCN